MKNILYLHAGAEMYGADIVLLELLKNIDKKKFKPYVILPCDGPLVGKLKDNNIEVYVIPYPILRRKYFNPLGILKYIKSYFKNSIKICKLMKEKSIDIIHINTAAVLEGIYIKKKFNIPLVWHIHEIIVKPKFMHKILSFLIAKNANEVVTVSKAVKAHLEATKYFKKEVRVIYNGVDNKVFNKSNETSYIRTEFNIPYDAIIVGMIGRVNAWKGQDDFLKAMEIVLDTSKNTYAMLIGGAFEGEEWRIDKLKEQINTSKYKERIVFDNYRVDSKNIQSLYDIFVLPSTNPDPLPTVVLEAMASSTSIVAYKHGGVCEMIKQDYNGLLSTVGDTESLANNINKLVNDLTLRERFNDNSLNRQLEHFSMKSYIGNFEKLYGDLT